MDKKTDFFTFGRRAEELPKELRLSDDFSAKLIFLKAESGSHILGFYTIENSLLKTPKIIFPNIGPESLIPNISSYTLPFWIRGKNIGFFLVNNGFSLNKNSHIFSNLTSGKNGSLCFMERIKNWRAIPSRNDKGELIWQDRYTRSFIAFCTPASDKSKNPILLWLSDDGTVESIIGHTFHSIAKDKSERLLLNPDGYAHSAIYFDTARDSLTLGFCELLSPEKKLFNDVRFKLMIGQNNYRSLFPQGIISDMSFSTLAIDEIDSVCVQITKDFSKGDVFRPFGLFIDDEGRIEDTEITLTNFDEQGSIILEGTEDKSTYENILKHVRLTNLIAKDRRDKSKRTVKITVKSNGKTFNAESFFAPDATLADIESLLETDDESKTSALLTDGSSLTVSSQSSPVIPISDKEFYSSIQRKQDTKMPEHNSQDFTSSKYKVSETKLNLKPFDGASGDKRVASSDTSVSSDNFDSSRHYSEETSSLRKPRPSLSPLTDGERRTVLITGAAKRIGKEIALGFASEGWNVIVHCNTSINEARELAKEISKYGVRSAVLQADLSDDKEVSEIFPEVFKVFPEVDCLINNASVFEPDTFHNAGVYSFNRHMRINLFAPFVLMQAFAKQFEAKSGRKGNIINITDASLKAPPAGYFSYSLSKVTLAELTKVGALALAPEVRVNAIAPWLVLPSPTLSARELEEKVSASPLGQKATPADIFQAIKFIIDSPSITGQTIFLDGGNFL